MLQNQPKAVLSQRGNAASKSSVDTVIWDVLNDQWDPLSNPDGIVSLGVAENALMHCELEEFVRKTFHPPQQAFTYGDGSIGSKRLRNAICRFLNKHLHPIQPIESNHIIVTNGVTTAIEHCAWACGNAGDGFLLGQPHYGAFIGDLGSRAGVKALTVKFGDTDPLSPEAVAKYEDTLLDSQKKGISVKGLMFCSPHNPLGRCYPRETVVAIMKLCQKYQLHLFSDEIYALSVWENFEDTQSHLASFTSVLAIDPTDVIDPSLVHVLWGMSKDFGANGLRLGCIISQNNRQFLSAVQNVALYSYPSSLSDHIAANVLEDDDFTESYINTNQERLAKSYRTTVEFLKTYDIPYAPGANAGFFLWVDLGKRCPEKLRTTSENVGVTAAVMSLLLSNKIFLANGDSFGSEQPGWFRIVFSHPEDYLKEGLKRIVEALELKEDPTKSS